MKVVRVMFMNLLMSKVFLRQTSGSTFPKYYEKYEAKKVYTMLYCQ